MFREQRALNYIKFSAPEESEKEVNIFKKTSKYNEKKKQLQTLQVLI